MQKGDNCKSNVIITIIVLSKYIKHKFASLSFMIRSFIVFINVYINQSFVLFIRIFNK
jgi:hypothetical protein